MSIMFLDMIAKQPTHCAITLAILWMVFMNGLGCVDKERQALLEFRQGLVDNSDVLLSWEGQKDCCRWRGISCNNRTGRVVALDLRRSPLSSEQALAGEISPSLLELRDLSYLDLSYNFFYGLKIPSFIASFSQLKHLKLANAGFSGPVPHRLGNLSNLHTLDLSFNSVSVDTLDWLSGLSSLQYLNLSGLNLSAVVGWSQSVTKLTSLVELELQLCSLLHDANPGSLRFVNSSMASLEIINLSHNDLGILILPWLGNVSGGNVVHIGLQENRLTGPIPDHVFANMASSLLSLDLSYNQLEGQMPRSFRTLCGLEALQLVGANKLFDRLEDFFEDFSCAKDTLMYLDLSDNQFWGPFPNVSRFSHLRELHLGDNNLIGTLENNFGRLLRLERLSLWYNKLNGSLPDFSGLPSLRWLRIHNNQLKGSIPESFGQLSLLEDVDLSSNFLNGTITDAHFSNLSRLNLLDISQNSLSLNVSSNWSPPFQLSALVMKSCKVGPAFPKWLRTQKKLSALDMSKTSISDSIPDWFLDLPSTLVYMNFSFNQIHGKLPHLSSKSSSEISLDFSSNHLYGPLPSLPPTTSTLILSKNMFSGSISSLCELPSDSILYELDLSDNRFSGELPSCWEQFQQLRILKMASNNFTGKLPTSLSSLLRIAVLRLRNNSLTGEIPLLQSSEDLGLLDLGENEISGKLPEWLGRSSKYLLVLRLRSNKFYGSVPESWCNLQALQVLDLSLNNITGTLPRCLANMTAMSSDVSTYAGVDSANVVWKGLEREFGESIRLLRSIDISSNRLSGTIPEQVTSLLKLMSLNLSRNNLTGSIPSDFGRLIYLESLDLSRNWLSAKIPASFSSLSFLNKLDLSYNNLTGRIPQSTQLQSFDALDYTGNLQLCGLPLTKYCPGDETEATDGGENDKNEEDQEDKFVSFGFYVSIGVGFLVGFWGVCGTLVLKKSWRYAYFQFFDNMNDWFHVRTGIFKKILERRHNQG